jgi:hypothetical protein
MRKAEIEALVRAHGGRARPVAFFHVLRQPALEADDHAFLLEHVDELGGSDLLRWRARCQPGFTGTVIRQLARLALQAPQQFELEVLGVPRLELDEHEWIELADLLRGKVSRAIHDRVLSRCRRDPVTSVTTWVFTPGVIPVPPGFLDDDDDGAPDPSGRDGVGSASKAAGTPIAASLLALRDRSMREVVSARRRGTLPIDDTTFFAYAMERARSSDEDWSFAVLELPDAMHDAVLEKLRRTRNGSERANLLAWLEAHGVPRAALLGLAFESIRGTGEVSYGLVAWLTRQLTTRAAWDKHGLEALSTLLDRRAFAEAGELVTIAWSEAGRDGETPPRGLLEAMQVAMALALLGMARGALARGDQAGAMAALSALACLDPPSRVSRAVHDLRRAPGAGTDVAELIAVNERLVKHSAARDASLEGIIAALHAIADASG